MCECVQFNFCVCVCVKPAETQFYIIVNSKGLKQIEIWSIYWLENFEYFPQKRDNFNWPGSRRRSIIDYVIVNAEILYWADTNIEVVMLILIVVHSCANRNLAAVDLNYLRSESRRTYKTYLLQDNWIQFRYQTWTAKYTRELVTGQTYFVTRCERNKRLHEAIHYRCFRET